MMDSVFSRSTQPDMPDKVPVEYLKECLSYDPESGALTWRDRPPSHFANERAAATYARNFRGVGALTAVGGNGYCQGSLRVGGSRVYLLAHRVAWALHYGQWPSDEIDHVNRCRTDNRIVNLRQASRSQNAVNQRRPTNAAGHVGVQRQFNKFSAKIRFGGRKIHIGLFDTAEEAGAAYAEAAAIAHGAFADRGGL